MKCLAHLSDLHFGRTDAKVVEALIADLAALRPDLVVISGDVTQRARTHQFAECRAFLGRLPAPALVVPGNHDLAPLYRPLSRLFRPRARFEKHLPGHHSWPVWRDDDLVVIGLDSTRHLRWTSGKLRSSHLDHVAQVLDDAPARAARVAFLHHPPSTAVAGHPFEVLAEHGIDLVLTGHVHKAHVEVIAAGPGRNAILVQASTACSTRLREDANGYGLIRLDGAGMEVDVRGWSGAHFHSIQHHRFHKAEGLWRRHPPAQSVA